MANFISKNTPNSEVTGGTYNSLTIGTKVAGDVRAENDFRLDGEIDGSIECKGKLVVGQRGFVKGNILCENAEVSGEVSGNVIINDTLSLRATAIVGGDITTKVLVIEPNAIFNGKCTMNKNGKPNSSMASLTDLKKTDILKND
ncbi:MAG: polymer-forming cytoskeletal protein [Prevotellaceae bacterium]|jgi:cytoskeletal protein CcmA (bactofilin family)|nr:polymer-forming cytoskeletal protein [Prevotellaceae bacterium]